MNPKLHIVNNSSDIPGLIADAGDIIIEKTGNVIHMAQGGGTFFTCYSGVPAVDYSSAPTTGLYGIPFNIGHVEEDDGKPKQLDRIESTLNQLAVVLQMEPEERKEYLVAAKKVEQVKEKAKDPFGWVR